MPPLNNDRETDVEIKDLYHRLRGLEDKTTDVAVSLARIASAMEAMQDHEKRIRELEINSKNNATVINAVKWITVSIVGSAITVTIVTLADWIVGRGS